MMVLLECTANDLKDENGAFKKWHRSIQINVPTCIYPEEFKIQFLTDNYTNFALFYYTTVLSDPNFKFNTKRFSWSDFFSVHNCQCLFQIVTCTNPPKHVFNDEFCKCF